MRTETTLNGLHDWQVDLISQLDSVRLHGPVKSATGINEGESQPTIRRHGGRTWIYKAWASDRHMGRYHVYAATTGLTHEITQRQYALLTQSEGWLEAGEALLGSDRSSDALQPTTGEIVELADMLAPLEEDGWTFPAPPEGARVEVPRVRVLMFNPTEQCNIRCTYCYYGGAYTETRPHQTASPNASAVDAALDLFVTGEERLEQAHRAVYFFGGEPLMAFGEIKQAVFALEEKLRAVGTPRENLVVQINSNGLLLTPEMVDFMVEHDIYLNISIDGPNHDLYRIDPRGKGTHGKVRERVEWLAEGWPDYFSARVALICVLSAPLDEAELYRYFSQWPTARQALAWDFDLVLPGGEESYSDFAQLFAEQRRVWDLFVSAHRSDAATRERSSRYHFAFRHGFLHRAFHRVLNQEERDGSARLQHLLGVQLVPGAEFLVLGADGTLYSSYEYQSPAFEVGHTDTGIDPLAGVEQLAMFRDAVQGSACRTCWAAPMCTVSVPEAPFRRSDSAEDVRVKATAKRGRCMSERENLEQALRASVDIPLSFGGEALDGHRQDWQAQALGGSRVDYFYA